MAKARSLVLPTAAVAAAALVIVVGVLVLTHRGHRKTSDAAAAVSSPGQAHQVAQALASLATDPQSLVASGAAGQVNGRARQAVPAGSTVAADERSWAPDGLGGGTMVVTVTAPRKPPVAYAAVMVSEGGRWKVLATFPLTTTGAAGSP
jgi:hypothetical protein